MSKKILVALRDLGKTNPFNFGTITTAYFLPSAPSFDYTQQGNFEVIAKGICHEEVTELRNLVPIGFYMMAALGKAYQEGKVNAGLFGQAYSDFKLSVETGIH